MCEVYSLIFGICKWNVNRKERTTSYKGRGTSKGPYEYVNKTSLRLLYGFTKEGTDREVQTKMLDLCDYRRRPQGGTEVSVSLHRRPLSFIRSIGNKFDEFVPPRNWGLDGGGELRSFDKSRRVLLECECVRSVSDWHGSLGWSESVRRAGPEVREGRCVGKFSGSLKAGKKQVEFSWTRLGLGWVRRRKKGKRGENRIFRPCPGPILVPCHLTCHREVLSIGDPWTLVPNVTC